MNRNFRILCRKFCTKHEHQLGRLLLNRLREALTLKKMDVEQEKAPVGVRQRLDESLFFGELCCSRHNYTIAADYSDLTCTVSRHHCRMKWKYLLSSIQELLNNNFIAFSRLL